MLVPMPRSPLRNIWPALVFATLLLLLTLPSPAAAQTTLDSNTTKPLTVCISDLHPLVKCAPQNATSSYYGFDIAMFREVARNMQLTENTDWVFNCTNSRDFILSEVAKPNSLCDIGLDGVTINEARQQAGIRFSFPYHSTSLAIVARATTQESSGWGWTKPFSASLWLAVLLTLIVFPILIFLLEFLSLKRRVHLADFPSGVEEGFMRTWWTLIGSEALEVSALSSRVAVVCFGFLALIVSSTYVANLASTLTIKAVQTSIQSAYDLRGLAVATADPYVSLLKAQYGIATANNYTMSTEAGRIQAFADVLTGVLSAVVIDQPLAYHVYVHLPTCDLRVLKNNFHPLLYGIAFSPSMEQTFIDKVSDIILNLQDSSTIEQLTRTYITDVHASTCSETWDTVSTSTSFEDLWGLWVILGGGLVLGMCIMLIVRYRKRSQWKEEEKALLLSGGGGDGPGSGGGGEGGGGGVIFAAHPQYIPMNHNHPHFATFLEASNPYVIMEEPQSQFSAGGGGGAGGSSNDDDVLSKQASEDIEQGVGIGSKSSPSLPPSALYSSSAASTTGYRTVSYIPVVGGTTSSATARDSSRSSLQQAKSLTGEAITWHSGDDHRKSVDFNAARRKSGV